MKLVYEAKKILKDKVVCIMVDIFLKKGIYKSEVYKLNKREFWEVQDEAFCDFEYKKFYVLNNYKWFEHIIKYDVKRFDSIFCTEFNKDSLYYILPEIKIEEIIEEFNKRYYL